MCNAARRRPVLYRLHEDRGQCFYLFVFNFSFSIIFRRAFVCHATIHTRADRTKSTLPIPKFNK